MDLKLRYYEQGDEKQVLELFREVYRGPKGEDLWRWQFQNAGKGRPLISVAEGDGTILGHYGIMRQDWSFHGNRVPAGQCCDAMVREALRGRGVFTQLGQLAFDLAAEEGLSGLMAFASRSTWPSSYAPSVKYVKMERVANFKGYHLRTGFRGVGILPLEPASRWLLWLARVASQRLARAGRERKLRVVTTEGVPDDMEQCLARFRAYEVLCVWRDLPYLKWRYESHPEHRYLFHTLRSKDGVEGYAVTRKMDRTLVVCDLVHRRKDVFESAFLLKDISLRLAGAEDALAVQFLGFDNGYFEAAFVSAGFTPTAFAPMVLITRAFQDGELRERAGAPYNWSIAYGDTDMV